MNFSLLEVNLVIVVIALLFSFSVGAAKLHKAVEMQTYIAEVMSVKKDVHEFAEIYDFLPGDLPYLSLGGACLYFADGTNICQGNGDGKIEDKTEGYLAWVHLADFRHQFFVHNRPVLKSRALIGSNVKASKVFPYVGMQILGDTKLNNNYFNLPEQAPNYLRMAGERVSGNLLSAVFSPQDLYFVDKKIDDGMPFRGVSFADSGSDVDPDCVTEQGFFNLKSTKRLCYQQIIL